MEKSPSGSRTPLDVFEQRMGLIKVILIWFLKVEILEVQKSVEKLFQESK